MKILRQLFEQRFELGLVEKLSFLVVHCSIPVSATNSSNTSTVAPIGIDFRGGVHYLCT
jgi:hypothetical protein